MGPTRVGRWLPSGAGSVITAGRSWSKLTTALLGDLEHLRMETQRVVGRGASMQDT